MKINSDRRVSLFSFVSGISFLAVICLISSSHAATYYHKYREGIYVYTNIPPVESGYKRIIIKHEDYNYKKRGSVGRFSYSKDYDDHISKTASWYGIDPYLVKAVIKVESNFNSQAVSPKGAMGVMQLMPETARNQGVTNPFSPTDNIIGGVKYLKKLIDMFNGNIALALAGYNAGENAVVKYGYAIPPYTETMNYVDKVLIHYNNLKNDILGEAFEKEAEIDQKPELNEKESAVEQTSKPSEKGRPAPKDDKLSTANDRPIAEAEKTELASEAEQSAVSADSSEKFTVQIASFSQFEEAQKMEQSLKSRSIPAHIRKTDIPGKGTWYRVRVGTFATREQAKLYGESIKSSELGIDAVLITSNK